MPFELYIINGNDCDLENKIPNQEIQSEIIDSGKYEWCGSCNIVGMFSN